MVFCSHVFSNAYKTSSYSLHLSFLWWKHMWPSLLLFIKKDVADILIPHNTYFFPPSSNFSFSSTESQKNLMGSSSFLLRLNFSQVYFQNTNPSLNGSFCHRSQYGISYWAAAEQIYAIRYRKFQVDCILAEEIFLWQNTCTAELHTHFCIVPTLATRLIRLLTDVHKLS